MNIENNTKVSKDFFLVITPDGENILLDDLLKLPNQDVWRKILKTEKNPEGIKTRSDIPSLMHTMNWVDPEPSSDKGHFRFYPMGALIFNLISDWLDLVATNMYESSVIITPSIYNWEEPATQTQAGIFDGYVYHVHVPDRDIDFALKFNGDIGLFKMMTCSELEQRHTPLRIHEVVRGFRFIQSGQVSHIGRGRTFSLLDMKSFCSTLDQGMVEYVHLHRQAHDFLRSAGHQSYSLLRTTAEFLENAKLVGLQIAKIDKHPIVVKVIAEQKQYWIMKHTIFTPHSDKVVQIQFDMESSARFNIAYTNNAGSKCFGPIIHNSLGSAERWMTIFLQDALLLKVPTLPVWLSPVQVRIIPVEERHMEECRKLVHTLRQHNIRADLEDRAGPLRKHIRTAECGWIPYIVIYGDNEIKNSNLTVRIRGNQQTTLTQELLIADIASKVKGKPFRTLPQYMASKHIGFTKMC